MSHKLSNQSRRFGSKRKQPIGCTEAPDTWTFTDPCRDRESAWKSISAVIPVQGVRPSPKS
jgi:hypothetical protein